MEVFKFCWPHFQKKQEKNWKQRGFGFSASILEKKTWCPSNRKTNIKLTILGFVSTTPHPACSVWVKSWYTGSVPNNNKEKGLAWISVTKGLSSLTRLAGKSSFFSRKCIDSFMVDLPAIVMLVWGGIYSKGFGSCLFWLGIMYDICSKEMWRWSTAMRSNFWRTHIKNCRSYLHGGWFFMINLGTEIS